MCSCKYVKIFRPCINLPQKNQQPPYVFGGYHKNNTIKNKSTSGGVFSAIVEEFCDENYVIFDFLNKIGEGNPSQTTSTVSKFFFKASDFI